MLVNDRAPLVLVMAGALSRFLWRHRSALAPINTAIVAFIVCAVVHRNHADKWVQVMGATAVAGILLGVPHSLLRRHPVGVRLASYLERMWTACGMDRSAERVYGAVVIATVGGWCSAAVANGPTTAPLPTLLYLLTILCGIPWWFHRRRRARVRVERITDDWPGLAESMGLPGSRIASAVVDAWGWTARVILRKGSTLTEVVGRISAIESALGVRTGSVRILPDEKRADRCVLRVVETDPHAQPLTWPAPAKASITKPLILGLFEDARQVAASFLRRHVLIGGVVGSGKSGVVNVIIGSLAVCRDAILWGIDLKEGMELSPWKSCLGRLATTGSDARELLREAVAELERRARFLTEHGLRVWEPTDDNPALVIVIDEFAELDEVAREYADSIARRGRAVAVTLVVATQRPTQETMGGATRSQMDIRICLRVRERRDTDLILGQGSAKAGWNASSLTLAGSFLISSPEHHAPHRARAYLVDDETVKRHAALYAPTRPVARGKVDAVVEPVEGPQTDAQGPSGGNGGGTTGSPSESTEAPDTALWEALRQAGPDGASVGRLMSASGMGRSWVYLRLREHAEAGRAVQLARGRWRAIQAEHGPRRAPGPGGPGRTRRAKRARRDRRQGPPNRNSG